MKALFFDIDGTLLSEITKEIPQSALDALKKTAEKGNLTFINTGRTWSELPEELKKLPFSGFLCGCGTYLRRDGEILMQGDGSDGWAIVRAQEPGVLLEEGVHTLRLYVDRCAPGGSIEVDFLRDGRLLSLEAKNPRREA